VKGGHGIQQKLGSKECKSTVHREVRRGEWKRASRQDRRQAREERRGTEVGKRREGRRREATVDHDARGRGGGDGGCQCEEAGKARKGDNGRLWSKRR
jgi:hypothetical protein